MPVLTSDKLRALTINSVTTKVVMENLSLLLPVHKVCLIDLLNVKAIELHSHHDGFKFNDVQILDDAALLCSNQLVRDSSKF